MAINVFTFSGNLGKDGEQKFLPNGDSIVSFSVPVKSGFGDKAITSWLRCSLFGKRGESVLPYLKKGQLVGVSGEFAARPWTNKEGQEQISNEVRVNSIELLGGKSDGNQRPANSQDGGQSDYAPPPAKDKPKPSFEDLGDDIPF